MSVARDKAVAHTYWQATTGPNDFSNIFDQITATAMRAGTSKA
jgi:hypothetical protein